MNTPDDLSPDLLMYVGEVRGMHSGEVSQALEGAGLPVRIIATVEEARATLRFLSVKMVVIGLDGDQDVWPLIRYGRQLGRDIPTICSSSEPVRARIVAALRRGATTFLVAPFTADDIRSKLAPLLGSSGADSAAAPPP